MDLADAPADQKFPGNLPNIVKATTTAGIAAGVFAGLSVKPASSKALYAGMVGFGGLGFLGGYCIYYSSLAVLDSISALVNCFRPEENSRPPSAD